MYRVLLTELDAGSEVHPGNNQKIKTDLVLDDGVPDVLRKFSNRMRICIIFPVPNCTGPFQNGLQFFLYFLKGSVMVLTWTLSNDITKRTWQGQPSVWIRFHPR